jgi:hypothetical protein
METLKQPCTQCRQGHVPGTEKTFDPRCPRCLEKLAEGLRTGLEPLPRKGMQRRPGFDPERLRKQHEARRAMIAALPTWRVGAL